MTTIKTSMTKQDEIDALRAFIRSLPADTYIGPWLAGVAPEVEAMIRSDFPINCSIREAQLAADAIRTDANEWANHVRESALAEATKIKSLADKQADDAIYRARQACHEAIRALSR